MQLANQYVIKVLLQLRCKVTEYLHVPQYLKYVISYPYDGIVVFVPNVLCDAILTFLLLILIVGESFPRPQ